MHILSSHMYQHVEYLHTKGLSIISFSMQGLEKQNNFTTTYFQRGTNKKGEIMLQIISKRNRIEILTSLNDEDLFRLINRPILIQETVELSDESEDEI